MGWLKKINSRYYALGTAINLVFAIYAGQPSWKTSWWVSFVVISAVFNQYFTIKALSGLVEEGLASAGRGAKILFYMVFKMAFLVSGFACLMIFASDKVLQGVVVYIFQLIILGLSIKNIGKFFKKGSLT
jgi:hypothetical protein